MHIRCFVRKMSFAALIACLANMPQAQAQKSDHAATGHPHTEQGTMQPELDHGQRWGTDAPLREGMARIRAAVAIAEDENALDSMQAQTLADAVDDSIAFMIRQCRLEPKVDANLHILLARLTLAAAATRTDPNSPDGLPQMLEVLELYPRFFKHPNWPVLTDGHGL